MYARIAHCMHSCQGLIGRPVTGLDPRWLTAEPALRGRPDTSPTGDTPSPCPLSCSGPLLFPRLNAGILLGLRVN